MNEISLRFPRESKEFRRGPDLPRHGESKEQESSTNPWSKNEISRGALGEKKVAAVEKERGVRAPPPPALFILELPGPDDPGLGRIIRT